MFTAFYKEKEPHTHIFPVFTFLTNKIWYNLRKKESTKEKRKTHTHRENLKEKEIVAYFHFRKKKQGKECLQKKEERIYFVICFF